MMKSERSKDCLWLGTIASLKRLILNILMGGVSMLEKMRYGEAPENIQSVSA